MDYETFNRRPAVRPVFALLGVALLAFMAWAVWLAVAGEPDKPAAQSQAAAAGIDAASAFVICENAIRSASVNPSTAVVPHARAIDNGQSWRYVWLRDAGMQLQNGFGAMVGAAGACSVDKASGRITQLYVNGETLI